MPSKLPAMRLFSSRTSAPSSTATPISLEVTVTLVRVASLPPTAATAMPMAPLGSPVMPWIVLLLRVSVPVATMPLAP